MPRAIVNITCPWCGGRVGGIESLDVPRRIPCPYCRTELHVPHVGDRVIVRELAPPTPPPPIPDHGGTLAVVATLIFIVIGLFTVKMATSSPAMDRPKGPSVFEQHRECERTCVEGCGPKPPDAFANRSDYDPIDMPAIERDIGWTQCSANCTLTCYR